MKKIFNYGLALASSIVPTIAFPLFAKAQTPVYPQQALGNWGIGNLFTMKDLSSSVRSLINIMLLVAAVVAIVYLIIGGYQYITAGGNAEQATAARTTILNALIGLVVIFSAFAVVNFVVSRFLQPTAQVY